MRQSTQQNNSKPKTASTQTTISTVPISPTRQQHTILSLSRFCYCIDTCILTGSFVQRRMATSVPIGLFSTAPGLSSTRAGRPEAPNDAKASQTTGHSTCTVKCLSFTVSPSNTKRINLQIAPPSKPCHHHSTITDKGTIEWERMSPAGHWRHVNGLQQVTAPAVPRGLPFSYLTQLLNAFSNFVTSRPDSFQTQTSPHLWPVQM